MRFISKELRLILPIICFIASCKQSEESNNTISLSKTDNEIVLANNKYSEIVDSLEFVPLETTSESLLGNTKQLLVVNSRFYLCDENAVKCFSENGDYLFNIGRKGRGHGEYNKIVNICYDCGNIYVFDQSVLYKYNADDGSFIDSKRLPAPCVQTVVKDGYVYCYDISDGVKLYCYSKDYQKKKVLRSSKKREATLLIENPLLSSGNHLLYCDPYRYKVFELVDGKLNDYLSFNLGEDGFSEKQIRKGVDRNLFDEKASFFGDTFLADDILYFNYSINNTRHYGYINTNNHKAIILDLKEWLRIAKNVEEQMVTPVASNGYDFYTLMSPQFLIPDSFDNPSSNYSSYSRLKNVKHDDNIIIVRIHLNPTFLN